MTPAAIPRDEARAYLVGQLGLAAVEARPGPAGVREVLRRLRCIQLDPLDPLGTNADLVALARVDGIGRGDVYRAVYPGHAFEHFAKERCLLPASAFPYYRDHAAETPWWRLGDRLRRLQREVIEAVLREVDERGPVLAAELADHGRVEPLDWSGWKGTARAAAMALEVLWTRCQVVVCGRQGTAKLYDVPRRALPRVVALPGGDFARWALLERVAAAGLLAHGAGAVWSSLDGVRRTGLAAQLVAEGALEEVTIEGSRRAYLVLPGFRRQTFPAPDDRMRILGPLDPLLWDRALVRRVFGFEYVWEVYKPAAQRRWGYYVCPLLHRGQLVGRIEGRADGDVLRISRIWRERGAVFDEDALDRALARHADACGASRVVRPRWRTRGRTRAE